MASILAVDDELEILTLLRHILERDGHQVTCLSDPTQLPRELGCFDLVLLDVMMPGLDGFTLCQTLREQVDCPILFLTAKALEEDILYGLGCGADDYLLKPFGKDELRARVGAHLRREQRERRSVLTCGRARFDLSGKSLSVDGQAVPLTKSEYAICELLARRRGQVFSKEQIFELVYGYDRESDSAAIAEHIKNIRAKLGVLSLSPIETVWGIGYKWN